MSLTSNGTSITGTAFPGQLTYPTNTVNIWPETEYNPDKCVFSLEKVQNGFILTFAPRDGAVKQTYVFATAKEASEMVLALLVQHKMEK